MIHFAHYCCIVLGCGRNELCPYTLRACMTVMNDLNLMRLYQVGIIHLAKVQGDGKWSRAMASIAPTLNQCPEVGTQRVGAMLAIALESYYYPAPVGPAKELRYDTG
jgi:hypothetical protein